MMVLRVILEGILKAYLELLELFYFPSDFIVVAENV